MVWPFNSNNQQQPQQNGALNLGLSNGQQQVPAQGQQWGQQQYGFQYQAPPTEMEILSAMITSNPMIDKWLSENNGANMNMLISLLSSLVAVSVNTLLANARLVEDGDGYKFDFSAVQGMPTTDSVTMAQTQILNASSNNVQQKTMQFQQMVQVANQSVMQNMLNDAMADPGMMQSVGQGAGSFLRSVMTGGR
tara:strand:- start:15125 stop:15703 length:579 start_codon:yes stop_codon:yes gene_type:complete